LASCLSWAITSGERCVTKCDPPGQLHAVGDELDSMEASMVDARSPRE